MSGETGETGETGAAGPADAGSGTSGSRWVRVASVADVPEGGCSAADADGLPIVLIKQGGRVTALENRCPHAGAPLSEGWVEPGRITCSWHGWTFDCASGASLDDPSLSVPAFEVRVEGDDVLVRR